MSRGLTGVLYDRDGNRKTGMKQATIRFVLFPIRLAVEAIILPIRLVQLIDNLEPLSFRKL